MTATTFAPDTLLDMPAYRGQRQATFRFLLFDFLTGKIIRELQPYKSSIPMLSHDTSRVIMRQISGLYFSLADTAALDTIRYRVKIQMIFPGRTPYDLGTYMFVDKMAALTTAGPESTTTMVDSMFIVDQQITNSYSAGTYAADGTIIQFRQVEQALVDVLQSKPVTFTTEPSPFYSIGTWAAGTTSGTIVNDLAVDGDYFAPWFDNTDVMRFIRAFDPSTRVPDFDYDANHVINRGDIVLTDDLLSAPNQFVVISNGSVSGNNSLPIVGTYNVPASAPHSAVNRGFVIPQVIDWQVDTAIQANAIATNLGQRQTLFQRVSFSTVPDPRHDSYNVFRFNGDNWLELAWSLPLTEGAEMQHLGRKAYS